MQRRCRGGGRGDGEGLRLCGGGGVRVRNPILSSMPSDEECGGAILFRSELHRRIGERRLGKRVNSSIP
ncbi:hypothetical protein SEVIR_5G131033v4 [Setaria viridis]